MERRAHHGSASQGMHFLAMAPHHRACWTMLDHTELWHRLLLPWSKSRRGGNCPFSARFQCQHRHTQALPQHRVKHCRSVPSLADTWVVILSRTAAVQSAHYLCSLLLFNFPVNCWEVFKIHQLHAGYF